MVIPMRSVPLLPPVTCCVTFWKQESSIPARLGARFKSLTSRTVTETWLLMHSRQRLRWPSLTRNGLMKRPFQTAVVDGDQRAHSDLQLPQRFDGTAVSITLWIAPRVFTETATASPAWQACLRPPLTGLLRCPRIG